MENPMLQNGPAWFLVADGRRARLYTEARRGAALEEAWALEIGPDDLYDIQDRPARAFDRAGGGRHAMDKGRNLHEAEEEKFLRRVAERVVDGDKRHAFAHLVIAAPPRALGVLRTLLPAGAQSRIRAETAKDLLDETAPKLRARLRDLLMH